MVDRIPDPSPVPGHQRNFHGPKGHLRVLRRPPGCCHDIKYPDRLERLQRLQDLSRQELPVARARAVGQRIVYIERKQQRRCIVRAHTLHSAFIDANIVCVVHELGLGADGAHLHTQGKASDTLGDNG
jgi:hypothetical protein